MIQGPRSHLRSHETCVGSSYGRGDQRRLRWAASGAPSRTKMIHHLPSCGPLILQALVIRAVSDLYLRRLAGCGSPESLPPRFAPCTFSFTTIGKTERPVWRLGIRLQAAVRTDCRSKNQGCDIVLSSREL